MSLDSIGNTFLVEGRSTIEDPASSQIPGSSFEVQASIAGRVIPLYYYVGGVKKAVVDGFFGDKLSPDAAEVTASNQLTVVFRTKGQAYVAGSYGWITIANFDLSTGILNSYYNFGSQKFVNVSTSDPKSNGPYYEDGNHDPYSPTFICIYDLKEYSHPLNDPYKAALTKFSGVFDPSHNSLPGSSDSSVDKLSTKPGADHITGISKTKDIFYLGSAPEYGASIDRITNFSAKDKDTLQFSKSAFGVSTGKFAIAKKAKDLNKVLATDANFVYNQQKGELIFNANGAQPGFGDDGGIFALLVGAPKILGSSVSFV